MYLWTTYTERFLEKKLYKGRNLHEFIGSTEGLIDWDEVIALCKSATDADHNSVSAVVDRVEEHVGSGEAFGDYKEHMTQDDIKDLTGSYYDLIDIWKAAGYRIEDIEWYDYYPGQHFDISVRDKFAELVQAKPLRVFISEIHPGKYVPYHWDIEDCEKEWRELGELVRYVCFIQDQKPGHIFTLDEHCFYNEAKHNVYRWNTRKDWHAGANCGFEPYYLFHFLGYK